MCVYIHIYVCIYICSVTNICITRTVPCPDCTADLNLIPTNECTRYITCVKYIRTAACISTNRLPSSGDSFVCFVLLMCDYFSLCMVVYFLCSFAVNPLKMATCLSKHVGAVIYFIHVFYLVHLLVDIRFMTRCTVCVIQKMYSSRFLAKCMTGMLGIS
jgi:hypothetical protein